MYSIRKQGDTVQTYVMEVVADYLTDINILPTKPWGAGSTCFVIEDASKWVLGSDFIWHLVPVGGVSEEVLNQAIEKAVAESKIYTDAAIQNITQFNVTLVDTLPTENIDPNTIYFVPASNKEENNYYFEYMFINNAWEYIGSTQIELSDYYTKAEIEEYIANNQYKLPIASETILGGVKVDNKTIIINEEGLISISSDYTTEETVNNIITSNITPVSDENIKSLF